MRGLVDQDIRPRERLLAGMDDRIDLEFGVAGEEDALIEALAGIDVLVTSSRLPVGRRVLEATELALVAKIGTGLDSVDLEAAAEEGVGVVHTPGLNAFSVAEHALSLLLAVNRNVLLGHRTLEAGGWRDTMPTGRHLVGGSVGIVGFGNVGSRLAGLLSGFHVDVRAYDPYVHRIDTEITGAELSPLPELLRGSDAVVVCAELTAESRGLIDAEALSTMPGDATLVNVSRGPIVDESALVAALEGDEIAGAGLDVFAEEPLPADSPLHGFDNVVLTPHLGASTGASRGATIDELAALVSAYAAGETLPDRFVAVPPDGD